MINENSKVELLGIVAECPEFDHKTGDKEFYKTYINITRQSAVIDRLPVITPYKPSLKCGDIVSIVGDYRSHSTMLENGKSILTLFVYTDNITVYSVDSDNVEFTHRNVIQLRGYICKQPTYRTTPNGRQICDLLVAVNRSNNKSDYIPCIAWNQIAKLVNKFSIGAEIIIEGRIQSRIYNKQLPNGAEEMRTAYEVSINELKAVNMEVNNEPGNSD